MIHLDVKTSNFLLRTNQKNSNRPTLLLADFGVARSSATTSSSSRTIRGTPTAMAPEHWSSKPVAASDQYSLAVMAYELLTGRPPFVGSMEQLMYQHFTAQPGPPSKLNPQLSPAVDQVLLRALAKKPEDRYPSITAFASALEEALLQSAPPGQGSADSSASLSAMPTVFSSSAQAGTPSLPPDMVSALPTQETPQNRVSSDPVSSLPTMLEPSQSRLSQPSAHFTEHDAPTVASQQVASVGLPKSAQVVPPVQPVPPPPAPKKARSGARIFAIIGVIVLLALVATAAIYGTRLYSDQQQANLAALSHSQTATAQAQATKSVPTATPTPTPPPGLYIAGTYNGSMFNSTTNQTTLITFFIRQTQGSGILNGSVTFKTSLPTTRSLSGTVDKQGNFSFSVQQGQGQQPLVFYGSVQNGVYLHGNFCNSTTNTCDSNTGYFTVGPRS
jgi:serine/threonine protein kinase